MRVLTPNWIKYKQSYLLDISIHRYTTLEGKTSPLYKKIDAITSYKKNAL